VLTVHEPGLNRLEELDVLNPSVSVGEDFLDHPQVELSTRAVLDSEKSEEDDKSGYGTRTAKLHPAMLLPLGTSCKPAAFRVRRTKC
jgi:hypothetical protein